MRVGIDTGGTFTDFIVRDADGWRVHKVLSEPTAPEQAILRGLRDLGIDAQQTFYLAHGSTVATNALLERKGSRCAFITNRDFADLLTLGRQARRALYDLTPTVETPPVPEDLCFETGGRIGPNGEILEPLTDADLQALRQALKKAQPEAVAINFLFSYVDDRFEQQIKEIIPESIFVSCSSDVLPEIREYERGIATWLNSYVGPKVGYYITALQQALPHASIDVMQSHGGTIPAMLAAHHAVRLLLSGPAGGLAAAVHIGRQAGCRRILSFDMGGTSTDVALLDDGIRLTSEGTIGEYPVATPMVEMHTIGAGGGSLAYCDSGGLLRVGPQSAGSQPGPACYARGGAQPTVTDAHAVLGWLPAQTRLAGDLPLDVEAAQHAVAELADTLKLDVPDAARGIVRIANENMAHALRVVSVRQGYDPKNFVLMAFGGAGGLHLCDLAEAMGMTHAMSPAHAGVFSALGLLLASRSRESSHAILQRLQDMRDADINEKFIEIGNKIHTEMDMEGTRTWIEFRHVDVRYEGQSSTLRLPWTSIEQAQTDFHQRHQERYGHALDAPVELVTLRLGLKDPASPPELPRWPIETPASPCAHVPTLDFKESVAVYDRSQLAVEQCLEGPAIVLETTATLKITPGWQGTMDRYGNIQLARKA